jgi:hypothetical protein
MLRHFRSPHPTFGSYKAPVAQKIEASPYFWWWYALTKNSAYCAHCELRAKQKTKTSLLNRKSKQLDVLFNDFGDVRYEGDRYLAFTKWWRFKVSKDETRGEYLFAEPPLAPSVRIGEVSDIELAKLAIESDDLLLIVIPKNRQRQHVDKALDKILKSHLKVRRGRTARSNPVNSKARYALAKPVLASALKKAFDLYDARNTTANTEKRATNAQLARQVGLKFTERSNKQSVSDYASRSRIISIQVSRYLATAEKLIEQAAGGKFGA